jgi:prolyl-tRNA synthetase
MVHSDDDGLILPPRLAPHHVVILPIIHRESDRDRVMDYCRNIGATIGSAGYDGRPVGVYIDGRDLNGGVKKWEWVGKGVPLIVELGPRDVEQQSVAVLRRYTMEKYTAPADVFLRNLGDELAQIQRGMFERARLFREKNMKKIASEREFEQFFREGSGYAVTFFVGDRGIEEAMKEKFNVTIRCILPPKNGENQPGTCAFTGQQTTQKVVWAKSY